MLRDLLYSLITRKILGGIAKSISIDGYCDCCHTVDLSVCRADSCTLLKHLDKMICYLAETTM